MKCTLLILCAVALCFSAYAATVDGGRAGVWTATLRDDDPSTLQISIFQGKNQRNEWRGWNNVMGFDIPLAEAQGLAASDIGAQAANVQFSIVHAAGTIKFEGRFSEGNGAGNFRFTPSESFVREMATLGINDFTDDDLLVLAAHDFAPQTLRDMRALGYDLATRKEVVEIAIFRITPAVVREFARLGYSNLTLRELVNMRVGRVDAAFVNGMKELGYNLSAREVANLAILGVTPAYVRELKSAGLTNLSAREAENLKIGHITAKRIDDYRRLGYTLEPKQLADFGIHGVTPEYINELRALGYSNIPASKLIEMKIFGVTPEYIRKLSEKGYDKIPLDKLLQLRTMGADKILFKEK
jgi:hypothetical protein